MKRFDLPIKPGYTTTWLTNRLLIAAVALVIVVGLSPFVLPPLLAGWLAPTPAPTSAEAWPTAPAAYAQATVAPAATARPLPSPTPLPIPEWRELSNLTSIEFTASSVVDAQRTTDVPLLGTMITDRLLLKAVGQVQVGIDLSQVKSVRVDGRSIQLVVPAPEVTSVELLPDQSQIYGREQVLFLSQYEGLETEALQQARQELRIQIEDNPSMMKMAEQFARLQLTEFLRKAGFSDVEIVFDESSLD